MSEGYFLFAAIVVFTLLLVGLILTILEFRHGEPKEEAEEVARRGESAYRDR